MKNLINQLLNVIISTGCICLYSVSMTWSAEDYLWPPQDGEQFITLVGPVYESGRETQAKLFQIFEQAMSSIAENKQRYLPKFFRNNISGIIHQHFQPSYSNYKHWESFKRASRNKEYDEDSLKAEIRQSIKYGTSGLKMAIRIKPTSTKNPSSVILEGYRFFYQTAEKEKAEWFTLEVKLTGRKTQEEFLQALIWLLTKSFKQAQKTFVIASKSIPIWKDKIHVGLLKFPSDKFTADAEPVRKNIIETCVQTRRCPSMKVDGNFYGLVSNIDDAQAICRLFDRELIDENTLLRLSVNKEGRAFLHEGNGAAWHKRGKTGYFKADNNHLEFLETKIGEVWCKITNLERSPKFAEHPPNYLINRTGLLLSVYRSDFSDSYLRFGKSMIVETLERDSQKPNIKKYWILDNALASDVKEFSAISLSVLGSGYRSISIETQTMNFVFECLSEVNCVSFNESITVNRYGIHLGQEFGHNFGFGFIQSNLDSSKVQKPDAMQNLFGGYAFEQPLWLIPGFRWSLLSRLDRTTITKIVSETSAANDSSNKSKKTTNIMQLSAGVKLSYILGIIEFYSGVIVNFGGSGKFFSGSTSFEDYSKYNKFGTGISSSQKSVASIGSTESNFEKVTIAKGISPIIGLALRW